MNLDSGENVQGKRLMMLLIAEKRLTRGEWITYCGREERVFMSFNGEAQTLRTDENGNIVHTNYKCEDDELREEKTVINKRNNQYSELKSRLS